MKLLTIIYDAGIDQSIMNVLDKLEVDAWSKFFEIQGSGGAGTKINTPAWPGINNQLVIGGGEEQLLDVAAAMRSLQEEFKLSPGIFMYLQEVQEY